MKSKYAIIGIVLALLAFGGWFLFAYNSLVAAGEEADAQWYQVENQYQRTADLIPNLVETVKGYAKQEEKILTEVTKYRSQWAAAKTQEDKIEAAKGMDSALSRLLVVVENYPELKSNENFLALQAQLEGTENRIAVERMRYNEKVREYNKKIKSVPTSVVANMYGFDEKPYFEAERGAEEAPEVKFGDSGTPSATATPSTTPAPTPVATIPVSAPAPSASVELYADRTDVDVGEDIILKLSAVNLITNPQMTVQVILSNLSGMSVTSAEFVTSGAGQYTSTFKLEPGGLKNIDVRVKTNQPGKFIIKGRIIYYFGDDLSTQKDYSTELSIIVRQPMRPGG
jgi:LemA protein